MLEELKRRKVLKSLGIYLVAAWVALQVAKIVAEIWLLPGWVVQAVFLLLVAGVPVTALLSWFYDVVPADGGLLSLPRDWRVRLRLAATVMGVAVSGAVLVIYLWPDEYLSEDVRRVIDMEGMRSTDPYSMQYALYGFDAPVGEDMWRVGRYRISSYNILGEMPMEKAPPLQFTVRSGDLCVLREPGCAGSFAADLDGLPALLDANAEMMARYYGLRESRGFAEVIRIGFDAPLIDFRHMMLGAQLAARSIYKRFSDGDEEGAWQAWADESAFHREMLSESVNLLTKMVTVVLVEADLRLYALMAATARDAPPPPPRLSDDERSFARAYLWEMTAVAPLRDRDRADMASVYFDDPAARFLFRALPYRSNRTVNLLVADIMDGARVSHLDAHAFAASVVREEPLDVGWSEWWLNTAGAALLQLRANFHVYNWRMHDLDALIVLTQVAARMYREGVTERSAGGFLLALPESLRNPYDGTPPVWRDGMLSFEVPGPTQNRRPVQLAVPLP